MLKSFGIPPETIIWLLEGMLHVVQCKCSRFESLDKLCNLEVLTFQYRESL